MMLDSCAISPVGVDGRFDLATTIPPVEFDPHAPIADFANDPCCATDMITSL
jgi:hypothetical protein